MSYRPGMDELIRDLRSLTETGSNDYEINDIPYWTEEQLQRILDNHRTDIKWLEMTAIEEGDGSYLEYSVGYGNLETTTGGTAIFLVQDVNGVTIAGTLYSADYQRGLVTFLSDTEGIAYYATGRSYDLNGAAADVWRRKQSHYARAVNFSTDGHRIDRAQLYEHAVEMAEHFELQGGGGFGTLSVMRSDTDD